MVAPLIVLGGYLLGSAPFGYWVVRLVRHEDVRTKGSGNIGATNVWRVYGRKLGIPVILLDIAKALVPALVGLKVSGELTGVLAGAAAMAGHWRPLYLGFTKGGKTVATAGGVTFALAPLAAACVVVVWLAIFVLGRYSLGGVDRRRPAPARVHLGLRRRLAGRDLRCAHRRRRAPATQGEHATPDRRDREPVPLPPGRARLRRRFVLALLVVAALATFAAGAANASTWCGAPATADLLPQTVSGPTVHFIYAYPSDGTDRLAEFGTTMQTDAETIDTWWRGQDPTRTPVRPLPFACGPQLDITDLRLPGTGADLRRSTTGSTGSSTVPQQGSSTPTRSTSSTTTGRMTQRRLRGGRDERSDERRLARGRLHGGCSGEPTAVTAPTR